jgi:ApeA N-terminal domain 1
MDYFTFEGTWWLPESPERQVPGTLTFDADGLVLVIYDSLAGFTVPEGQVIQGGFPEWKLTPMIHGCRRNGKDVTLLRAEGANREGPSVRSQTYRIETALVGAHIADDSFTEVWCSFDCLDVWAQPPSLTTGVEDGKTTTVRVEQVELGSANVDVALVRLVTGVSGKWGGEAVHLDRWSAFAVRVPAGPARSLVEDWVRPLQDLLTLSLGRAVRLTSLCLVPTGTAAGGGSVEVTFAAVQAPPGPSPTWSSTMSYTAPTLLTFADSPVPFNQLVPRWFEIRSQLSDALVLLMAPYYVPSILSEHRYASTFQSAEALARARFGGQQKSKADHQARVDGIIAAAEAAHVPPDDIAWARRVLQSRNDKTLAQLMGDLVNSTGSVGEAVLAASPKFCDLVATARTGVSHPGAKSGVDPVTRYWQGEVLRWIIRARALTEIGMPLSEVERRVSQRAGFSDALQQIQ